MASAPLQNQYPGVDLPLRYLKQDGWPGTDFFRLGSFEGATDSTSDLLPIREVAMMILMDRLTDKPNWHEKVFDDVIVAKWRDEALTQDETDVYDDIVQGKNIPMPDRSRIITPAAFDYCIAELKCKAAHFKETGLVFTVNSAGRSSPHSTAIKADAFVSGELRQGLKAALEKLRAEQGDEPDWHPWTNEQVQDLVHPSMYPFIYGKTQFIQEEAVGVTDAVDKWAGKGAIVPKVEGVETRPGREHLQEQGHFIDRAYWSTTYQWLPANLAFQADGTVRFTSYINNLHPKKHPEIYRLVEQLVDRALPAWQRVLSSRPVTEEGETQCRFGLPPTVDDDDQENVWEAMNEEELAAQEAEDGPIQYDVDYLEYLDDDQVEAEMDDDEEGMGDEGPKQARKIKRLKWREIRDAILPEPEEFKPFAFTVGDALRARFKDTGLQVIVKMASIELTPEKPDFPVGGWHIEGQMNEHIVATALYYLDSENVTPSQLSFRMHTTDEQEDLQDLVGQDMYKPYERIYGTALSESDDSERVQSYGSVETPEGRLLAFPNVFLQDATKPGHRRFIALWLVDPLTRVISTANVPPQQADWWAEAVFGSEANAAKGDLPSEVFQLVLEQGMGKAVRPTAALLKTMDNRLPPEVMEMVRRERVLPEALMTAEEAREHRIKLMEERSAFVKKNDLEWKSSYSFCEH
ncbi:hypothetical protein C8A05DRAFT_16086 [Staphylotrichum tortipilum]|uniref:Uncharacterized protein n=1 Tax=Staphylotrichum tortipilum TaxID=2831512 RepID=A0AAN6MKX4_9PEZI|nr:hypothetical protein C8A05DRAFT_16086 [Staphylotrichum longicolle]